MPLGDKNGGGGGSAGSGLGLLGLGLRDGAPNGECGRDDGGEGVGGGSHGHRGAGPHGGHLREHLRDSHCWLHKLGTWGFERERDKSTTSWSRSSPVIHSPVLTGNTRIGKDYFPKRTGDLNASYQE